MYLYFTKRDSQCTQKYAERSDRDRKLQTVSKKQANMQTRQLQLLLRFKRKHTF